MAIKLLKAKFSGKCHFCAQTFPAGTAVQWDQCQQGHVSRGLCGHDGDRPRARRRGPECRDDQAEPGPGPGSCRVTGPGPAHHSRHAGNRPAPAAKDPNGPQTQKARGIVALQKHSMLSKAFAAIALTEADAVSKAEGQGFPCFVRPCPITPRHGFVDSRVVKSAAEVVGVWGEAKKADPAAELIVMPYVNADFNMVWRPGLLAVGPGHDGATAGHDSISIFLQSGYTPKSGVWQAVAADAGVDQSKDDPFLEAVTSGSHDTVITQVRAGVKGTVTAPDWCPAAFTIGEVVTLDDATKPTPDAMLDWEMRAKTLTPGYHVVHNPGGNLGDHWSVHAQLNGIAVVTSFTPKVGDVLPKLGIDLVPLDPSAIVWGFLGGAIGPSLKTDLGTRRRAVCAAIMGVHHGLRMGGPAGVHIGASVAFILRLAQAAVWGEARHAEHKGLSREQVYKGVLDDWITGREGLGVKVTLMHTHHWGGGFGGKPWAAIGHATMDLDRAMIVLLQDPTEQHAIDVVARLNALVNLAHNNGWFLNKFCDSVWFDLAADLDPRVALMAGPVWYQATTVDAGARLDLLDRVSGLVPIQIGHKAPGAS